MKNRKNKVDTSTSADTWHQTADSLVALHHGAQHASRVTLAGAIEYPDNVRGLVAAQAADWDRIAQMYDGMSVRATVIRRRLLEAGE